MHTEAQYRVAIEAKVSIVQDEGAGVGLQPNGLAILDQLGVLEEIEELSTPLRTWHHVDGQGNPLKTIYIMEQYAAESSAKNRCKWRKRLVAVSSDSTFATVQAEDGSTVKAEVVIGADGVHSCVRRHIDCMTSTPLLPWLPGEESLSSEFACVYGISDPVPGVYAGESYSLYCEHAAVIAFTGRGGRLFWFAVEHLGQALPYAETLHYTASDAEKTCLSVAHLQMNATACFGDVWENHTAAFKVGIEEGMAPTWVANRAVIVGDSAHKGPKLPVSNWQEPIAQLDNPKWNL
ncbi:hypothetical protein BJY01DRAFT_245590 [Aspergillus pseudoustus]|uniref:FAD-binding domain-containing protein n=1 Tax=Aspergillus pseudoustus TaxID=1810923 RepID=A0ABR4KE12_9EURO